MAVGPLFPPDLMAMALSGLITTSLALKLAREPDRRATLQAIAALVFASLWALSVILEFSITSLTARFCLVMFKPFAVMGVVTAMLILVIEHTGILSSTRRRALAFLLVVPAITAVFTFVPERFHLYRYDFRLRPHGDLFALTWIGGPWDRILHYYGYILMAFAVIVLSKAAWNARRGYRRAMLITASSWLIPFVGDLLTKLRIASQETNLTGYGMCIAAVVSAWALLVERCFTVGPVARKVAFEQMSDILFVLDAGGKLVDCNSHAARALGLRTEAWLGVDPDDLPEPWRRTLQPNPDPSRPMELGGRSYAQQQTPLYDHRGRRIGHSILLHDVSHLELMRQEIAARNEELAKTNLSLTREIEHRKATEKRLTEAERMETVGRLAGGVAHDFNNLLTVINGYATLLLDRLPQQSPDHRHVEQIRKAGERAAELTRQLLTFSRRQPTRPRVLNINSVVTEARTMLARLLPESIELRTELNPDPAFVTIDPGQIQEILLNLAANSRDAMPTGGSLTIRTGTVLLREEDAATHPDVAPGPCVLLSVTDTGVGISEAARPHVFEPFYTTRDVGQCPGLGLSMVYGIVRQNQGCILLESEPGAGTAFHIYLRQTLNVTPATDSPAPPDLLLTGTETILVVEDQDQVRDLVVRALRIFGYHVFEAPNGAAAMDFTKGFADNIDLLLTDLVMPGMSGLDLARQMLALRPATKLLCMSGYAENVVGNHDLITDKIPYIRKPMSPEALATKVREVLGSRISSVKLS